MEKKRKSQILITFSIIFSLGVALSFIPLPLNEVVLNKRNSAIVEGVLYLKHSTFPWPSISQQISVRLQASNGTFSLLILDEDAFDKWFINETFSPIYRIDNITDVNNLIFINPPYNSDISFLITANTFLVYGGMIETNCLRFYINWGGFFIGIGIIGLVYLILKIRKQQKISKSYKDLS